MVFTCFSYETFKNDKWHQQNPDWTVCNRRIGEYFYNLKRSTTFDKEVLVVNESDHKKFTSSKFMSKKFFKIIDTKYLTLINEFLLRSTFIQNEIETENAVTSRIRTPCKTYIQSSYSDDNNYNSKSRISLNAKNNKIKND